MTSYSISCAYLLLFYVTRDWLTNFSVVRDFIEKFCVMCDWNLPPPSATLCLHRWEMCYAFSYDYQQHFCALPAPNL